MNINIYLQRILASHQVNDFKCVFNNTDGHQFLAIVSAVHHERIGQPLHDGALSLTETFGRVPTSRMRQIFGVLLFNGNVILTNIKHTSNNAICTLLAQNF